MLRRGEHQEDRVGLDTGSRVCVLHAGLIQSRIGRGAFKPIAIPAERNDSAAAFGQRDRHRSPDPGSAPVTMIVPTRCGGACDCRIMGA
jgi:hypothetical protein